MEIGAETRVGGCENYSGSISPQNRTRSAIRQLYTWTKHTQRYGEYKGRIFFFNFSFQTLQDGKLTKTRIREDECHLRLPENELVLTR